MPISRAKPIRLCTEMESLGLTPAGVNCSACGSPMFSKPCPCFMRRKGWKMCAKCPKCGTTVGTRK